MFKVKVFIAFVAPSCAKEFDVTGLVASNRFTLIYAS